MAAKYPSDLPPIKTTESAEEDQVPMQQDDPESRQLSQRLPDSAVDQDNNLQLAQNAVAEHPGVTTIHQTINIETQNNAGGAQTFITGDQTITVGDGEQQQPQPQSAQQREGLDKFDLAACQEELRDFYLDKMGKVQLLPWVPEEIKDMESIFVDLELVEKEQSPTSASKQKIEKNEDLVTLKTGQGKRANRVLLSGDAGSGKSTIAANIAYKWTLNDPQSSLNKFDVLFLIKMVDIEEGNTSIVDIIFDQILDEDSQISREGLQSYVTSNANASNVLFVFDGLDEYHSGSLKNKSSKITKILQNKKLRKSCVILTTRPHKKGVLGEYLPIYKQVNLIGFSSENVCKYIHNFFEVDPSKAAKLVQKLQQEPHILALAGIPVLLLMICLLWADQCNIPNTKTQLYQKTVYYIWKRYQHKHNIESSSDDESDDDEIGEDLNDLLNKLGEVAFQRFHPPQVQAVFSEKDFGSDVCRLGCEVGLISRESMRKNLKRISQVKFLHLTFLEFCIAVHFTHLIRQTITQGGGTDKLMERMFFGTEEKQLFIVEMLDFCCGLEPKITELIIKSFVKHGIDTQIIEDKPIAFHPPIITYIFESQLSHDKCLELVQLFSGFDMVLHISSREIPSVLYLLQLFKSTPVEKGLFAIYKHLKIKTGYHLFIPQLLSQAINLEEDTMMIHKSPQTATKDLDQMYKALSKLPNLRCVTLYNKTLSDKYDITNLLIMLTQKNVRLTKVNFVGFLYDVNTMSRFLSNLSGSLEGLTLVGTLTPKGQPTSAHEILKVLPNMRKLTGLSLTLFQIGSAVKKLRPIVSQLTTLGFGLCALQENHMKELFMILSRRGKKLKILDLFGLMLTVTSVNNLVDCLRDLPVLEELLLMNTGLTDETACILAACLKEKSSLHTVNLARNPGIGPQGQAALEDLPVSYSIPANIVFNANITI